MRCFLVLLVAACGSDHHAPMPDAAPLAGDFSCAGVEWPTTAADMLTLPGQTVSQVLAPISGVTVEVHDATNDALLGSTTSGYQGKYQIPITTGGVAPQLYRSTSLAGYVDTFEVERHAEDKAYAIQMWMHTPAEMDAYYAAAGVTREPGMGTLELDIYDCAPKYVVGATIDAPGATVIYLDDNLQPDPSLTAQTAGGGVLVLNAPVGTSDITVHAGPVIYRSWPVQVRADALVVSDRMP